LLIKVQTALQRFKAERALLAQRAVLPSTPVILLFSASRTWDQCTKAGATPSCCNHILGSKEKHFSILFNGKKLGDLVPVLKKAL
jgi:hypothetical protein